MFELLRELCALPGVTGDEGAVRDAITAMVQPHADEVTVDALGNLTVVKKGAKRSKAKLIFAAHMDEVGVIVTRVTDDGYLKFAALGGIDKRVLPGKRIFFGGTQGVIGLKPPHLSELSEREKPIDISDLYIDIGAADADDAKKLAAVGDTGTFGAEFLTLGENLVRSKAIDDRVGCAALVKLIRSELPLDATFVFTVQEEAGTRGAAVAANRLGADIAVIIEGTTAADLAGVSDAKRVCKLGAGAVSPFMDGGSIYDRGLWNLVRETAAANGIAWQTKEYISGGTDASAFQKSGTGAKVVGIAAPVRNLHSAAC
ncbi:MAG: M20/M25/M40 family metallo-hydrolase, partial [Oscillospiraceae bacterium]|nr:M20/M25/M40 family metallo-hydrolase [Oscillospiraceae bacterium]